MKISHKLLSAILVIGTVTPVSAQYSQLANQLQNVITPALSGSFKYKGYAEASYIKNLGDFNADFIGISTSQGFQYASWFFMGAGMGVDLLFSHPKDDWGNGWLNQGSMHPNHDSVTTAVMMPLFTDFRLTFGNKQTTSFFIDLKIGCSFLLTNSYIKINNGYLTDQEYFYLKPSLGARIPTNPNNTRQAVNIGISYQLLTSNYWRNTQSTGVLSGLGAGISYEW